MEVTQWVSRVLGLLLTISPSIRADEIEIVGRLQIQAQLEHADERARITGRLLDELGRPVQGVLVVRATDPKHPLQIEPCLSTTATSSSTTKLESSQQGEYCGWLDHPWNEVTILASAEHYESAHMSVRRDQSLLVPPRFISVPTTLTRGSKQLNTLELHISGGAPAPGDTGLQLELSLRCAGALTSLGKQPVQRNRIAFAFVTPADSPLGTCQLEAELKGRGMTSAIARADVLVRSEVTLQLADLQQKDDAALVGLLAQAGADLPTGALEATRGPLVIGSMPLAPRGATQFEVPLLTQAGEVTFRFVPGSSEFFAGAPVTVSLPARQLSYPAWLWHSIGALCFLAWLAWRWLSAGHPRTRPASPALSHGTARASAQPLSHGAIRGSVFDVSTRQPLNAVQLTLVEPRADGENVVESTVSRAHGEFQFKTEFSPRSLLRLRATREHFMTLATAVTGADFVIELRSTRRAALESLIIWAKRSGLPWDVAPTPTTGHVRQLAEQNQEPQVAAWATEVERAAFGPASPSEPEVTALGSRSPKDPHRPGSFLLSRKR